MLRVLSAWLAAAGVFLAVPAGSAQPAGDGLTFQVLRNGADIGRHSVQFRRDGDRLTVEVAIDLRVRLAGITVYRYEHRASETWSGDALVALSSRTNDNGKRYTVEVASSGGGLLSRGTAPADEAAPSAAERLTQVADARGFEIRLPAGIIPTSHWNRRQIEQTILLNTQTGEPTAVAVRALGVETVRTSSGSIQATRYEIGGEVRKDAWYDSEGRWVKSAFRGPDNSPIEYVLQR